MGHKRRRENTAREYNKLAHSQKRQFLKIEVCQKLRTVLDVDCRYDGYMNGYIHDTDKTKQQSSKLKSKYRQYDIDKKLINNISEIL